MSEPTIEIEVSVLNHHIPGWGESNMDLVANARTDIDDAMAILQQLRTPCRHDALRSAEDRLLGMAVAKLKDANNRVDICHNELDCEREDAERAAEG